MLGIGAEAPNLRIHCYDTSDTFIAADHWPHKQLGRRTSTIPDVNVVMTYAAVLKLDKCFLTKPPSDSLVRTTLLSTKGLC